MSKAFDTVDRAILLKDLQTILDKDELHLIKIMFDTELTIQYETEETISSKLVEVSRDAKSVSEFTLNLL